MGNRPLAFFAEIRHLKTWKTESLNVVTDLTRGIRGETTQKPLFKVFAQ